MATIRPQQLGQVDYSGSNALLARAQQMITGGIQGVGDTIGGYRDNLVANNTAKALSILQGATSADDLAQRQSAVNDVIQQSGGDIDMKALIQANSAMPDLIMKRQEGQNALATYAQNQHDLPIRNQALALLQAGDQAGAQRLIGQLQGDASGVVSFAADRQDAAAKLALQKEQVGLQAAGLALRRQAMNSRATQAAAGQARVQGLIKQILGINGDASTASTKAAVDESNAQLKDAEANNPLNRGNSAAQTENQITNDNRSWYSAPFPNSWRSDRGGRLSSLIDQLDPNNTLTDKQRTNMLKGMNDAYENTSLTENPDAAALKWGKDAMDALGKARTQRLQNTESQIEQRRTTQLNNTRLLLGLMLSGGNGLSSPMTSQLITPDDDEE